MVRMGSSGREWLAKPRFVALVNQADDTGAGDGIAGNGWCDGAERCNGAVKDRQTELIWLANADCFGGVDWATALQSANGLESGACGLRDGSQLGAWRLPNIKELQSLIDFQCAGPALSDRQGTGCFNSDSTQVFFGVQYYYWSSTTYAGWLPWVAWVMNTNGAAGGWFPKDGTYLFVWPVRGGQLLNAPTL